MVILLHNVPKVVVAKVYLQHDSSLSHTPLICTYFRIILYFTFGKFRKDSKERKKYSSSKSKTGLSVC